MDHRETAYTMQPIGIIHSEHTVPEKTPIQPVYARDCQGRGEVFPDDAQGLRGKRGYGQGGDGIPG